MNLEIRDSSFPSTVCSLARGRKLCQIVLCCQRASPTCSPSTRFPRCGDAPRPAWHPAFHTQAAPGSVCCSWKCWAAGWAVALPPREFPTTSSLILQHFLVKWWPCIAQCWEARCSEASAQEHVHHGCEQPAIPTIWLTDNLTRRDSSDLWSLLSVNNYTRGSGQEHLGLLCIALVLLWNKAPRTSCWICHKQFVELEHKLLTEKRDIWRDFKGLLCICRGYKPERPFCAPWTRMPGASTYLLIYVTKI